MRKKDFDKEFIQQIANNLDEYTTAGFLDKPRISMEYNNTTDAMNKNGEITDHQKFNWCTPKKALDLNYLKRIKTV